MLFNELRGLSDASFADTANLEVGEPNTTANLEVGEPKVSTSHDVYHSSALHGKAVL